MTQQTDQKAARAREYAKQLRYVKQQVKTSSTIQKLLAARQGATGALAVVDEYLRLLLGEDGCTAVQHSLRFMQLVELSMVTAPTQTDDALRQLVLNTVPTLESIYWQEQQDAGDGSEEPTTETRDRDGSADPRDSSGDSA